MRKHFFFEFSETDAWLEMFPGKSSVKAFKVDATLKAQSNLTEKIQNVWSNINLWKRQNEILIQKTEFVA